MDDPLVVGGLEDIAQLGQQPAGPVARFEVAVDDPLVVGGLEDTLLMPPSSSSRDTLYLPRMTWPSMVAASRTWCPGTSGTPPTPAGEGG